MILVFRKGSGSCQKIATFFCRAVFELKSLLRPKCVGVKKGPDFQAPYLYFLKSHGIDARDMI